MNECCTIQDLHEATGIPRVTLLRRLVKCGCSKSKGQSTERGKAPDLWHVSGMTPDLQLSYWGWKRGQAAPLIAPVNGNGSTSPASVALVDAAAPARAVKSIARSAEIERNGYTQAELNDALARGSLMALYRECARAGWGHTMKAKDDFVTAYNLGEIGSHPALFRQVGPVCVKTLDQWAARLAAGKNDPLCLLDRRGKLRKGRRNVTEEEGRVLEAIILSPNAPLISEAIRQFRARLAVDGRECAHSDDTLRRYIDDFRVRHYDRWIAYRQGEKALNDKCLPHIERDYSRIAVGDIAFCDGHTLNFDILNPWTGQAQRMTLITWFDMLSSFPLGWEIAPTENTQAIAAALFRACVCLGRTPRIAYLDNGKAFRSKFFSGCADFQQTPMVGLFRSLGMDKIFAWSYHGETKTVERWHKTLAEFERQSTSYTGTSIDAKPPRLNRGERLHRKLHQAVTGGCVPSLEDAHRALASWIDEHYGLRPQRGHLKGRTPRDVFEAGRGPGLSPEEQQRLRLLMMSCETRKIYRDGIKLPWSDTHYYHPDLYGRQLQRAIVRYDLHDRDRIYVYDLDNRFICEARCKPGVHPAARILGTEADVSELARQIELRRSLGKQTIGPARQMLDAIVLPDTMRRQESADYKGGERPSPVRVVDVTPAASIAKPMSKEDEARIISEFEELQRLQASAPALVSEPVEEILEILPEAFPRPSVWDEVRKLPDAERMERLLELEAMGDELPLSEKTWMTLFERMGEYQRHKEYWEAYRLKMALLYQERVQ